MHLVSRDRILKVFLLFVEVGLDADINKFLEFESGEVENTWVNVFTFKNREAVSSHLPIAVETDPI